ncbi:transient receptor potential cation channel subfamily A member 1-like [Dendronephthya gigantea]|uniref:transient receptor potential cation channel subfamily A member 1-like n=1 Tax=Dendronephthya gigantea TaxID=151771 RepID=UPI0010698423|nr:transient receptor potential cation channel subfamily A member 1-like [Dendronephthya gigantea]
MFAALNNQKETLELLLSRNAQLFAPSHADSIEKKKTCLDWAVENRRPDIVRVILTYDQGRKWEEAMKKSWVGPDGLLAKMVVTMPEVAIEFLNECVKTRADGTSEYDFFALQTKKASEDKPGVKSSDQERVTSLQAIEMMAKYSRVECLNHVVVQKFLDHKWSVSARNWYFSCFGVYIIFLLSLTTYITLIIEGRTISSDKACAIIAYICWVFVILSIIKEGFQLFHQKWQYFCVVSTYLELIMYVCVLIFLPYDKKSDLQRLAGAIAIFLGWINFAWFLKLFPNYGIYIIMAKKIFITFFRVCVPLSFFIIAFSMTFFVLFNKKDDGFDHIVKSFLTSFAMMVGEVDYRDAFLVYEGKYITKVFILIFLALFLILMSILLMNLLTGLAVGDIGVIMRRSLVEKQIQKALLIVDMDKHLNKYPSLGFGGKYVKPLQEGKKPNTASCVQNLKNVIFPRLDIQEEKEACENNEILRQLDNMQNTLHELKKSLRKTQTNSLTRNGEYFRPRRNTTI